MPCAPAHIRLLRRLGTYAPTANTAKHDPSGPVVLDFAASLALSKAQGASQRVVLTGNITIDAALADLDPDELLELEIIMDVTGGHTVDIDNVKWIDGTEPTWDDSGDAINTVVFRRVDDATHGVAATGWAE